jgi:hypothetical protein
VFKKRLKTFLFNINYRHYLEWCTRVTILSQ